MTSFGPATDPWDEEILSRAHDQGRVLVTLDKDFGELAIVHGKPHDGIVRMVAFSTAQQAELCVRLLESHGEVLQRGAIVTARGARLRVRRPEDPDRSAE